MLLDVSGAFSGLLLPYTVRREVPGTRDANTGAWIPGAETPTTINAVIQNANADDLKVLPEGERSEEVIKIHTVTKLITADEETATAADEVEYQGGLYKVRSVSDRKVIGNYYKALAIRTGAL